ncbi:hypothetical protein, partial [Acinetobacter baumannii]|uniref:hypothetical protein n=1 Tax=Acinetobacter baumannii TaxID=470 RepID=UPI001C09E813
MDNEEILSTFYNHITVSKDKKDGWRMPYDPARMRGYKTTTDLIDADSGEVVLEAGKKLAVREAKKLAEKGLKALRM